MCQWGWKINKTDTWRHLVVNSCIKLNYFFLLSIDSDEYFLEEDDSNDSDYVAEDYVPNQKEAKKRKASMPKVW